MTGSDIDSAPSRTSGARPVLNGHTGAAFRPDVQGLRGIAVLLVVIYHAWPPALPGGFVGVDVFFVISGFLISGLLVKELQGTGGIDLIAFYGRRMRRLLPASLLVTCVTLLAFSYLTAPMEAKALNASGIAATAYMSNFWFAHLATDYLQGGSQNDPFLHTWSLAVEEQFYLFWPAFLLLLAFIARKFSPQHGSLKRWLMIGIVLLSIGSLAICWWLTDYRQPLAFFASPTRAWEFGLGGIAALMRDSSIVRSRTLTLGAQWVGVACIALTGFTFSSHTIFPGLAALLPCIGSFLIVALPPQDSQPNGLAWRPLTFVGDLSYSWYLWHWPLMVIAHEHAEQHPYALFAAAGGSLVLAWLSYTYVETPARKLFIAKGQAFKMVALGLSMSVAVVALGIGLRAVTAAGASSPTQMRYTQARQDRAAIYADNCNADFFATTVHPCEYGDRNSPFVAVLFGDSHAAQWFSAMEQLAVTHRWRLVVMTKSSCPPIEYEPFNIQLQRLYVECPKWRDSAFAEITRLHPDILVISSSSRYTESNPRKREEWRVGMERSLARMDSMSPNVIVIRDPPTPGFDVPQCLARAAWRSDDAATCDFAREDALDKVVLADLQAAVAKVHNARVIDLNRLICPDDICKGERADRLVYMDSNHLTAAFNRELAPHFFALLPHELQSAASR